MSKDTLMQRYEYDGGFVDVLFLPDSRMYEVWEHISDAYGTEQVFHKRTKVYPEADALALEIVRMHDNLTSG